MERKVLDCDRCGAEDSVRLEGRLQVAVGRGLDAAGSNETDYRRVDLCPNCLAAELGVVVKKMTLEEGKAFWDRVMNYSTNRPKPQVRLPRVLQ